MNNSRSEGIFYIVTKKPYKIAINGELEERNNITCKDITAKCEMSAANVEQLLTAAMMNVPQKEIIATKKQILADEKEEQSYYDNDNPTDDQIKTNANMLKLMFNAQTSVKLQELMDEFLNIIFSKRVVCEGDIEITQPIWDTVDLQDKLSILFRYCSFFANPLQALVNMD